MVEVSDKASEMIKKFLAESEGAKTVRILMDEGGWKGPHLVLALDEKKENDELFTEKGVSFVIARTLLDQVKPVTIDYVESALGSGYVLKSDLFKGLGGICSSICESC
jgi:HesB-like selenoprotein